jgi:hypothetical protein
MKRRLWFTSGLLCLRFLDANHCQTRCVALSQDAKLLVVRCHLVKFRTLLVLFDVNHLVCNDGRQPDQRLTVSM